MSLNLLWCHTWDINWFAEYEGKQVAHNSNDEFGHPTRMAFQNHENAWGNKSNCWFITSWQSTLGPTHYIRKLFSPFFGVKSRPRFAWGMVKLENLFKRFDRRGSYNMFEQEFFISRVDWERHVAIIIVEAFLGIMIFLKKRDLVNINLLPMVIYMFRWHVRLTTCL